MALSGWDKDTSPYHRGERALHERLGRKEMQDRMARQVHRTFMPDQHREFFAQLPFFIAGSFDSEGWPWASILFGESGFVSSPDDKTLLIKTTPLPGDPLSNALAVGTPVGFVGIELPTRRRNRVNGVVTDRQDDGFQVSVVQSFGNCPQYIHTRGMTFVRDPAQRVPIHSEAFTQLDDNARAVIQHADTLFVASYNDHDDEYDTGGADVNHRGGKPGFIKVEGNTLTIPDYVGNFAFNTLGNFLLNPKAGLLFIDFANGNIWQMTGTVELLWDKTDEVNAFRGAERAWRFHLDHGVVLQQAAPLRWENGEASPNALLTGDWNEAGRVLGAEAKRKAWRPFKITQIKDESAQIRSFFLQPADGDGLLDYKPGQFLTLRVSPDDSQNVIRTYTLSSAPSDTFYRISVQREDNGLVSNYLHDHVGVGDHIDIRAPNGSFCMDVQEQRPAALIAGGVGITPMVAMAREAVRNNVRRRHLRALTIFHAAQTTENRAFAGEFAGLQRTTGNALRYISVIGQPEPGEKAGHDFHFAGRITTEILQGYLPLADYDFYLCGPPAFMQAIYDLLLELGVRDRRIFAESFGLATLTRALIDANTTPVAGFEVVDAAIVTFDKSNIEQAWTTQDGTLLDFAQAHGLTPEYGCRNGACGSCAVRLISGKIGYKHQPTYQIEQGEVLLCCAVPARSAQPLRLDL